MENTIAQHIKNSAAVKEKMSGDAAVLQAVERAIHIIAKSFADGGKLLIAGNGGSAADSQHFAAEIVGRYMKERKGYPAIALSTNSSVVTAVSNDYSPDMIFSRQVEALGKNGDVFFGISTSGNSKNIIEAVKVARAIGLHTICLLGKGGGALKDAADVGIIVPSDQTAHIQESHITLIHAICGEVEKSFT